MSRAEWVGAAVQLVVIVGVALWAVSVAIRANVRAFDRDVGHVKTRRGKP